jgi:hypothetical protein
MDHESQHSRVWVCQDDSQEFETEPEYVKHLEAAHHESRGERLPKDADVDPSSTPHRDCPFCPTRFFDSHKSQTHIAFHLERIALLALPGSAAESDGQVSPDSSLSREVKRQGRQDSLCHDFEGGHLDFTEGTQEPHIPKSKLELSKAQLTLLASNQEPFDFFRWLQSIPNSGDSVGKAYWVCVRYPFRIIV